MHEKENKSRHTFKLQELQYKTLWRISAALEIFLASFFGAYVLNLESDSKAKTAFSVLAISALSFMASDGVIDLIKGTHHFVGLQTLRLFSSKKGKEDIDKEIKNEMRIRDKKPSDFKQK